MVTIDASRWVIAWFVGAALGAFFFGGLWWTVCRAVHVKLPAVWFLFSLLVRLSVVLVGFYFVSGGRWERLLAGLLGFAVARSLAKRMVPSPRTVKLDSAEEARHAS